MCWITARPQIDYALPAIGDDEIGAKAKYHGFHTSPTSLFFPIRFLVSGISFGVSYVAIAAISCCVRA